MIPFAYAVQLAFRTVTEKAVVRGEDMCSRLCWPNTAAGSPMSGIPLELSGPEISFAFR